LRYQATASCAVGRAMRLFFQHRRAKRDGLLLVPEESERTNGLPPAPEATPANDDATPGEPAPPAAITAPPSTTPRRTNGPTGFRHDMPPLDSRDLPSVAEAPPPLPEVAPPAGRPRGCTNGLLGSASPAALAPFGRG
jgi:hypothetical protein